MSFLNPSFLWALLALAIPLVIHLFNFRRYTRLPFSNTRLLQSLIQQSKAINRLRQLLLLLLRMLALALLVAAFARPYLPGTGNPSREARHLSFYLDNSPSMGESEDGRAPLHQARSAAVELIRSLPHDYRVQILTNDFSGRQMRFYPPEEAVQIVDETEISYAFRKLDQVQERIQQAAREAAVEELDLYLLSDFQESILPSRIDWPEAWNIRLLPLATERSLRYNVAVDSLWFDRPVLQPGFDQELQVRLRPSGDSTSRELSLNLHLNGALHGARSLRMPAAQVATASFSLRTDRPGTYHGQVKLDDQPPYFDNQFYFNFAVEEPFRVLLTGRQEHRKPLTRLFADSVFSFAYRDLTDLDYPQLGNYDLIILDAPDRLPSGLQQALRQNLQAGQNIFLLPANRQPGEINELLANWGLARLGARQEGGRAGSIAWRDPHFDQVFNDRPQRADLPLVKGLYDWNAPGSYTLIAMEDGRPLSVRQPMGEGELFVLTAPLEASGLLDHPLIVPLMLNAALFSRQNTALYTLAGQARGPSFSAPQGESPLELRYGEESLIPRQRHHGNRIELFDLPSHLPPGIYPVVRTGDTLGHVALNSPPEESIWRFATPAEAAQRLGIDRQQVLEASGGNLAYRMERQYRGTPLWPWFLAGAILFLILEMILLKWWK